MCPAARKSYSKAFDELSMWMRREGLRPPRTPAEFEGMMLLYIDCPFEAGGMAHDAELASAAARDRWPGIVARYLFLRIRRALAGFRKQRPPRSRPPLPKEILASIAKSSSSGGTIGTSRL